MKKKLMDEIKTGKVLVADGAMGTILMERGLEPGAAPESFNLENIPVLEEIAQQYFEAGADIIQTNTFGGSSLKLSMYALDEKTEEINTNAVRAVKKVVGDHAFVSGSCGPTAKMLKPYGDVEPDVVYRSFRQQMNALISSGVDVICVETMIDIHEATLAVKAAKAVSSVIPVMATMTFDATPKGFYTVMGTNIETAAHGLEEAGADVIGSNCGNGIENMVAIAEEFRRCTHLPLIIQSNAGIPQMRGTEAVYGETPTFMAEKAKELVAIGVSVIGGCCGTTPAHIKALRSMVNATGSSRV